MSQVSALWPQAWDLLTAKEILSLDQIYLIWIAIAFLSLITGTFFLPWFNINDGVEPLSLLQLLAMVRILKGLVFDLQISSQIIFISTCEPSKETEKISARFDRRVLYRIHTIKFENSEVTNGLDNALELYSWKFHVYSWGLNKI